LLYRHYEELKVLLSQQVYSSVVNYHYILQAVCFWVFIQTIFIAQENKITRVEMVKRMMIIVGEELLLDTLTKVKYSVSYSGSILYMTACLMITSKFCKTSGLPQKVCQ
jgi:hypothetical protein